MRVQVVITRSPSGPGGRECHEYSEMGSIVVWRLALRSRREGLHSGACLGSVPTTLQQLRFYNHMKTIKYCSLLVLGALVALSVDAQVTGANTSGAYTTTQVISTNADQPVTMVTVHSQPTASATAGSVSPLSPGRLYPLSRQRGSLVAC